MNSESTTEPPTNTQANLDDLLASVSHFQTVAMELQNKINTLEAELKKRDEIYWEEPFYWTKSSEGKLEGPFCQRCYDTSGNLMRLHHGLLRYRCIECGQTYQTAKQKSAQQSAHAARSENTLSMKALNLTSTIGN